MGISCARPPATNTPLCRRSLWPGPAHIFAEQVRLHEQTCVTALTMPHRRCPLLSQAHFTRLQYIQSLTINACATLSPRSEGSELSLAQLLPALPHLRHLKIYGQDLRQKPLGAGKPRDGGVRCLRVFRGKRS